MSEFRHQRHKSPLAISRTRELILVCAPLRSRVNLSRIVRTASCCGIRRIIACGNSRIDPAIARVQPDQVVLETHRSLEPCLKRFKDSDYGLVGLEQTTASQNLHTFDFARKTVLVIGNERQGISDDALQLLDAVVEIPVYGMPHSYNVATAAAMALYEYCRQFPDG